MATTCIHCRAKLPKEAKFCPSCGEKPYIEEQVMSKSIDPILKVDEAAALLKIGRSTVYLLLDPKRPDPLPYFNIGRDKRFITDEVLAWARRQQVSSDIAMAGGA